MRAIVIVLVTAVAIGLLAVSAQAADVNIAPAPNATPTWQRTGYYYDGSYPPACPHGYYFACRYNHYFGDQGQCACWPFMPYWLFH